MTNDGALKGGECMGNGEWGGRLRKTLLEEHEKDFEFLPFIPYDQTNEQRATTLEFGIAVLSTSSNIQRQTGHNLPYGNP